MSVNTHQDLIEGLAQIKTSEAYHDFVIHCESRSWNVHRVVICLRSQYFRKVCDSEFEEARKGEITLVGMDPDIVDRMIDYLYVSDYNDVIGAEYLSAIPKSRLIVNAMVYALAEKYGIDPLKDIAVKKTEAALKNDGEDESFLRALDMAWTSTPQSDRGLRDCYLSFINSHTTKLRKRESFFGLLRSNAELMVNVVETSWDASAMAKTGHCESCTHCAVETQDNGWPASKKPKKKGLWM